MSQFTVDQALQIAIQYQQNNQLFEAEDIYRQILAAFPDQPDALHLLGMLAHQCQKHEAAEDFIRKAIAAAPESAAKAPYRLSLGSVLQAQNRLDDAIVLYQKTIEFEPENADSHAHLGVALSAKSRFAEAVAAFEGALQLAPNHPAANGNLGIALCHLGRYEDAVRTLRAAVAHQPKVPAFHASLAAALYRLGQFEAGAAACHQALALDPRHGQANQTLALIYIEQSRLPEAAQAAQLAADAMPEIVEAQLTCGEILGKLGRLDEALAHYKKALARHPDSAELFTNLANVHKDRGELDDAIAAFRRAAALRPDHAAYHSNLLYTLHFHSGVSPQALYEEHRLYNQRHAMPLEKDCARVKDGPGTACTVLGEGEVRDAASDRDTQGANREVVAGPFAGNDRNPARRLRVGYISNEFRGHVIGLNLIPLLSNHRKEEVETFCYSDVATPDFFTYRFQQWADHWIPITGKTDQQIADLVRRDQIDILVDLSLHLAGNHLLTFARKPAPIQISFAGYPGTTGLTAIDYRLTDRFLEPLDTHTPSSEIPLRFGDAFWCYYPQFPDIPVNTLPAKELGYITFGNFNNFCKINDKTLELWALVMRNATRSRLIMLTPEGSHRSRTKAVMEKNGIAPDRVDFVPRMAPEKYFKAHHRIDVGLDSFPYNGHTTSLDSFYMGVPVVTLIGNSPVSRAGHCQLQNLKLPELAGKSASEFVKLASELANNWPRLGELRATLRPRLEASPLMNQQKFAANIEAAYRTLWERYCQTESAARGSVNQ